MVMINESLIHVNPNETIQTSQKKAGNEHTYVYNTVYKGYQEDSPYLKFHH